MPKKVLIIVSNAYVIGPHRRRTGIFLPEVAHPYAEFDRANYHIDFASLWQPYSICDGHLVTGQNPASAKSVAEKMIKLLERV